MKRVIQMFMVVTMGFWAFQNYAQSNKYYMDAKGNISDEKSYTEQKENKLKSVKKIAKFTKLYEELEEVYNDNDSIVYSYTWYFTPSIRATKKEIAREKTREKNLIGKEYPVKNARTLSGRMVSIDDLKGKPTLINLWFTGCKICVEEMPALNKMKKHHSDRFNFLSITMDSEQKVLRFLKKFNYEFEHIVNSKELTTKMGFKGYPVNLFLDKKGTLQFIKGNVPFEKNENGDIEISDGAEFIALLETLI